MNEHDTNDARLRELMRAAAPEPPIDEVDWSALHARVMTRARPVMRRTVWWQTLASWSSRGIPAAAAAAVAAAVMLGTVLRPSPESSAAFVVIEEELAADLTGSLPLLVAGAEDDVVEALLFYDGEEP